MLTRCVLLKDQIAAANAQLLEQTKALHEATTAAEMQQLEKTAAEEQAQEQIKKLSHQSEILQKRASAAEKVAFLIYH